jgi:uncharacterized protein YndB with AHSA1/START domain
MSPEGEAVYLYRYVSCFLSVAGLSAAGLFICGAVVPAAAAVVSSADNGFLLRQQVHLPATPQQVYDALVQPGRWWNPEHTFSGSATNMTLDARAGGCFCETLPGGGSVQHLLVVLAVPGKTLVLRGALGPFQGQGVDGALTWKMAAAGSGTDLTMTYTVGGYLTLPGGFTEWSKQADAMFASQVTRLQRFIEPGFIEKGPH